MKLLLIAALATSLAFSAENSPVAPSPVKASAPNPDALTPAQIVTWKAIQEKAVSPNQTILAKKANLDARKLAYYEAKEEYERVLAAGQADIDAQVDKLKADAKCSDCLIDNTNKDNPKWVHPQKGNK